MLEIEKDRKENRKKNRKKNREEISTKITFPFHLLKALHI